MSEEEKPKVVNALSRNYKPDQVLSEEYRLLLGESKTLSDLFVAEVIKRDHQFRKDVVDAMFVFQIIENMLQIYINTAIRIVSINNLDEGLQYDRKIKSKSMGGYIELMKIYCQNTELITKLNDLRKDRNYIAHEVVREFRKIFEEEDNKAIEMRKTKDALAKALEVQPLLEKELDHITGVYDKVYKAFALKHGIDDLDIKDDDKHK